MKKTVLLTAILAFAGGVVFAQTSGGPVDPKTKAAVRELMKNVRDWAQANVVPSLKVWKGKLDGAMTSGDLQDLDKLRDEATLIKNVRTRLSAAILKAREARDTSNAATFRAKVAELKHTRTALLKQLKPIGEKYQSTLRELGAEATPKIKEWKVNARRLVVTWLGAHRQELGADFRKVVAGVTARMKTLTGESDSAKARLMAARFMLWDGKDLPLVSEETANENAQVTAVNQNVIPDGYSLSTNYPNPFNPSTNISFTLPKAGHVSLVVYDVLGKVVANLIDSELSAGTHTVVFDGKNLASGTYIYRIRAGEFVQEKTMQMVK